MTDHTRRKWNSLTQLKNTIADQGEEKIISFCGHTLVTDRAEYQLFDRRLIVKPKKGRRTRSSQKPK